MRILIFLLTIFISSVLAQTENVMQSVYSNNAEQVFKGIINNEFSSEHMDLLDQTIKLQNDFDEAIVELPERLS